MSKPDFRLYKLSYKLNLNLSTNLKIYQQGKSQRVSKFPPTLEMTSKSTAAIHSYLWYTNQLNHLPMSHKIRKKISQKFCQILHSITITTSIRLHHPIQLLWIPPTELILTRWRCVSVPRLSSDRQSSAGSCWRYLTNSRVRGASRDGLCTNKRSGDWHGHDRFRFWFWFGSIVRWSCGCVGGMSCHCIITRNKKVMTQLYNFGFTVQDKRFWVKTWLE